MTLDPTSIKRLRNKAASLRQSAEGPNVPARWSRDAKEEADYCERIAQQIQDAIEERAKEIEREEPRTRLGLSPWSKTGHPDGEEREKAERIRKRADELQQAAAIEERAGVLREIADESGHPGEAADYRQRADRMEAAAEQMKNTA